MTSMLFLPVLGLFTLGGCSRVGLSRGLQAANQGSHAALNPLIAKYRQLAQAYRADAREAEAAAQLWSARARAATYGSGAHIEQTVSKELHQRGSPALAAAVGKLDRMLADPKPLRAAAAAREAEAPYKASYREYQQAGEAYAATAEGYAQRADADIKTSARLSAYALQQRLQSGAAAALPFERQAQLLTEQARKYRETAANYRAEAKKVDDALPYIKKIGEQAGAYAAYSENPDAIPQPHEIFSYTVAPPVDLPRGAKVYVYSTAEPSAEDSAQSEKNDMVAPAGEAAVGNVVAPVGDTVAPVGAVPAEASAQDPLLATPTAVSAVAGLADDLAAAPADGLGPEG